MAKRNSRHIELTIVSAESLSLAGNRRVKRNPFVIIKIPSTAADQTTTTTVNAGNGSNPTWNQKFYITMPMDVRFLTLEVRCRRFSGDRFIGSATVPATDFSGRCFPAGYLHILSYRLRDKNGERNGIVNISIKVDSNYGQRVGSHGVPLHLRY